MLVYQCLRSSWALVVDALIFSFSCHLWTSAKQNLSEKLSGARTTVDDTYEAAKGNVAVLETTVDTVLLRVSKWLASMKGCIF